MSEMDVKSIYTNRFAGQMNFRKAMWQVLCREYFQKHILADNFVVEIGAGYCEFINSIRAAKKIAVDINPDTSKYAGSDVQVIQASSTDLKGISSDSVDRVFASNCFEHLSRTDILTTLAEIRRIIKTGGKMITLQPNFRYCYKDYYMFFDHISALDHRSMEEALVVNGFTIQTIIPRFLPYTSQGSLPKSLLLLRLYLRLPVLWKIFGGQMLIIATK
jgi:ubiquinone/menaquinone biosynthesis C-methylase UbiE